MSTELERQEPKHTPGPWHVERRHAEGADPKYDTFSVLAPNPDAGKEGVPYAGQFFSVAQCLDCEADAYIFGAALEFRAACEALLAYDRYSSDPMGEDSACEALDKAIELARAALEKATPPPDTGAPAPPPCRPDSPRRQPAGSGKRRAFKFGPRVVFRFNF